MVAKLVERGGADDEIRAAIDALRLDVRDFDVDLAHAAGSLRRTTRPQGLSLGDRGLSCARSVARSAALTADRRTWLDLGLGVDVRVIR